MIESELTLVAFLPVCCSEDEAEEKASGEGDRILVYRFISFANVLLDRGALVTRDLQRREKGITVFNDSMTLTVKDLPEFYLNGIVAKSTEVVEWKYILLLVSVFCDVAGSKKRSTV